MSRLDGELIELCPLSSLEETGARGIVIGSGLAQRRYIVVRAGEKIRCYINQCPHQGTPLDTFPNKFLDDSGKLLVCSTHGARFRVADGFCVAGPCKGERLGECQVEIKNGKVYLRCSAEY